MLGERELRVHEAEELMRVGHKLSAVLESLPVGVMIADVEGRVCQMTEQVSRILECTHAPADSYGEMLGWWDGAGRLIKDRAGPLARAIHGGETAAGEPLEIECVDGRRKRILISASPLRGLDGRLVGAVVLLQDHTEPRNIDAALQERVTRLVSIGVELEEST
jgi:PAS domain-containing protein